MDFQLRQRGRAAMHFLSDLAVQSGKLRARVDAEITAHGLDDRTLADGLDDRLRQVDAASKSIEAQYDPLLPLGQHQRRRAVQVRA